MTSFSPGTKNHRIRPDCLFGHHTGADYSCHPTGEGEVGLHGQVDAARAFHCPSANDLGFVTHNGPDHVDAVAAEVHEGTAG